MNLNLAQTHYNVLRKIVRLRQLSHICESNFVYMKISEICEILSARVICGAAKDDSHVYRGYASDLMSDVLTLDTDHLLLLTGMCNLQTIRTAEMADIRFIAFVRNKKATEEMLNLAREHGICIMESPFSMFKSSGLLFSAGLKPVY